MASTFQNIRLDRPAEGVVVATLNRPGRRNALTDEMFDELVALQRDVDEDPSVRALVITGEGQGFCAGLDLDLAATLPGMPATEMYAHQQRWARSITGFTRTKTPVIAAVNGAAAGAGLGLALAADVRLGSTSARFNAAFIRIGLSAGDVGCSWSLPRIVGLGRAMEIMLTGRFVEADEALAIGLVSAVVPDDELVDRAIATATMIGSNSPFGVQLSKEVILKNIDAPSIEAAVELENRSQVLATRSADMAEALDAFRERRPPRFAGS